MEKEIKNMPKIFDLEEEKKNTKKERKIIAKNI